MFMMDNNGSHFPVSAITSWRRAPSNDPDSGTVAVKFGDGDVRTVRQSEFYGALANAPQAIVPAAPETYLIESTMAGGFATWKAAVVAWAVTVHGQTIPITLDGIGHGKPDEVWPILFPDGRVEDGDEGQDSFAEWEDRRRERYVSGSEQAANDAV